MIEIEQEPRAISPIDPRKLRGLAADEFNWNLWALKWSSILIGGSIVLAAIFIIPAAITHKPGTKWERKA